MEWSMAIGNVVINALDVIILVLVLIGGIGGALEGFASSFASKAGYVVALCVGLMFTKSVAPLLASTFSLSPFAAALIAYILLFYFGFLLTQAFGNWLTKVLNGIGLGPVNTVLGFIWGCLLALVVICVLLLLLKSQQLFDISGFTDKSYFVQKFLIKYLPVVQQGISNYV